MTAATKTDFIEWCLRTSHMPPVSKNLEKFLNPDFNCDDEVDLEMLCCSVAEDFGKKAELARALIRPVTGKMKQGTLELHLLGVLKSDSAVRDVLTVGHLAKFLSRLDIFFRTSDYRIIGMPNRLFDRRSQEERTKYFEHGASLELEGDAFESPEAQAMLNRESEVFDKYPDW